MPENSSSLTVPPPGAIYIPEFLTSAEEALLVKEFDARPWFGKGISPNPELRRCTQHYGHIFSYRSRAVDKSYGDLNKNIPDFVKFLLDRIYEARKSDGELLIPRSDPPFDLLIVNEYLTGEGIMPHIDSPVLFGPNVISISLLSDCVMDFAHKDDDITLDNDNGGRRKSVLLEARSLLLLQGESRFDWSHSISKNEVDQVVVKSDGSTKNIPRHRRISLTFRSVQ